MAVMSLFGRMNIALWRTLRRTSCRAWFLTCLSTLPLLALAVEAEPAPKVPAEISLSAPVSPEDETPKPPRLALEAILGKKAVISINGERAVLAVGETSPSGLRLLSLNDALATVEFEGQRQRLRLGQAPISTRFAQPELEIVTVAPDKMGMYVTPGAINGHAVKFLVDTGATTVAMNANTARRLGVDYRLRGRPVQVNTASGQSRAYFIQLNEVSIGGIRAHNVGAVVLEGAYPQQILLGMSFLGQLQMQRNGMLLELRQKY